MKKRVFIAIISAISTTVLACICLKNLCNFCGITILSILSFLFFYKINDYIANFKTLENNSRIDILFLLIFFIWLFIPMSHISNENNLKIEHRKSAEFKNFIIDDNINYEFGKNFNDWFNDRFFLRDDLVELFNKTSVSLLKENSRAYIDKDWIFTKNEPINKVTKEDMDSLIEFNKFCEQNGIKLYILIVPTKNDVYFSKKSHIIQNKGQQDFQYMLDGYKNELKIVYPYDKLIQHKKDDYMYFKTDHHWTDNGAYIGYSELMKIIKKDFNSVKVQTPDDYTFYENKLIQHSFKRDFGYGLSCGQLGLSNRKMRKYHKTAYHYWQHKDYKNLVCKTEDIEKHRRKEYFYQKGANLRVILLGTSHADYLSKYIPYTFKYVKRIRNNNVKGIQEENDFKIMKYYKNEILEYKPDILIFCISNQNAKELDKIFNME